jgi:ankyrin repeat protein
VEVLRVLLAGGASLDLRDDQGRTPLLVAAVWGRVDALQVCERCREREGERERERESERAREREGGRESGCERGTRDVVYDTGCMMQ